MSQSEENSLTKTALIALAKAAWSADNIKKRTDHLPYEIKNWHGRWNEAEIEYASEVLKILPPVLKTEFEEVFSHVGKEIKHWKEYLSRSLGLEYPYTEVTYLTSSGQIDEPEILAKYWLPNRLRLPANEDYDYMDLLCMFGQEQLVYESRNELVDHIIKKVKVLSKNKGTTNKFKNKIRKELRLLNNKQEVIDFVLSNWINVECMKKTENRSSFVVADGKCRTKSDVLMGILSTIFDLGHAHLFKYFWKESVCHIESSHICSTAIEKMKETFRDLRDYEKKNRLEIISMLLHEIPECEQQEIFKQHYLRLLQWMYGSWRYQGLFLKIVEASCFPDYSIAYIFTFMAEKALNDSRLTRNWHTSIFERVVLATESHINDDDNGLKYWKVCVESPVHDYILDIILNLNTPLLTKIMSSAFFHNSSYDLNLLSKRIEFMEKFLGAKFPQRELVVTEIRKLREDLLYNNCCYLNELNALSDFSDKHGLGVGKKDIDGVKFIIKKFNTNGIEYEDHRITYGRPEKNFIKWYFDPEDERLLEIKKFFQEEERCRKSIFDFFVNENGEDIYLDFNECEAQNFVNFICYFRGKKIFSLENLWEDASSVYKFVAFCNDTYHSKFRRGFFFPIECLLQFCNLSKEKIEELKIKCMNDIHRLAEYYEPYGSYFTYYKILDSFFAWLTKDQELRRKFIKDFMESPNGVKLFQCTIDDGEIRREDKLLALKFFNEWVKSCKNITEMRNQLIANKKLSEDDGRWNNIYSISEDRKFKLLTILDKLETGENILSFDLKDVLKFGRY